MKLNLPLQDTSKDIWKQKYQLKDMVGTELELNVSDTFDRVAKALASVEEDPAKWEPEFRWAMENGAIPAGRISSNAGAGEYKPSASLINCTVSQTVQDSMEGILEANKQSGITLAAGCGIGYEFSTLRPKGSLVGGVGATTSGALSFMNIFDSMCFTVSSAGGRRGAQMATFDVSHPDVIDFIKAKREDGSLRQFNLSLLVTKDFMEAVKNDGDWTLNYPVHAKEFVEGEQYIWKEWPCIEDHHVHKDGLTACKIYKTVKASYLYDIIMKSTYDFAEPGFILIDEVNALNPLSFCEKIRATNPCGEQPLPPDGACLLGSINLTKMLEYENGKFVFNWDLYKSVVKVFTRMLDNVVELNGLPLENQRHEITYKRRHGMGFTGLGSMLNLLEIPYDSKEGEEFTEEVTKRLAVVGFETGVELAKEKGPAPIFKDKFDGKSAKVLFAESRYIQKLPKELIQKLKKYGSRFTHHSSIAPTGTISLSFGNNCSNGIEPSFCHSYSRNVIKEGKNTKQKMEVLSYEALVWKEAMGDKPYPASWRVTDNVDVMSHVNIQAAAQRWIDSSISKTINVPTDYDYEEFKKLYMYAYDMGLKGCTTFRFNPEAFQGVLVKDEELANTKYKFVLESGEELVLPGSGKVEYDGETHEVNNLFDALKEGYYGKF